MRKAKKATKPAALRHIVGAIKGQADRWYETVCGRP